MPVVVMLEKQKQEEFCQIEASLGFRVSPVPARATNRDDVSKPTKLRSTSATVR